MALSMGSPMSMQPPDPGMKVHKWRSHMGCARQSLSHPRAFCPHDEKDYEFRTVARKAGIAHTEYDGKLQFRRKARRTK